MQMFWPTVVGKSELGLAHLKCLSWDSVGGDGGSVVFLYNMIYAIYDQVMGY